MITIANAECGWSSILVFNIKLSSDSWYPTIADCRVENCNYDDDDCQLRHKITTAVADEDKKLNKKETVVENTIKKIYWIKNEVDSIAIANGNCNCYPAAFKTIVIMVGRFKLKLLVDATFIEVLWTFYSSMVV